MVNHSNIWIYGGRYSYPNHHSIGTTHWSLVWAVVCTHQREWPPLQIYQQQIVSAVSSGAPQSHHPCLTADRTIHVQPYCRYLHLLWVHGFSEIEFFSPFAFLLAFAFFFCYSSKMSLEPYRGWCRCSVWSRTLSHLPHSLISLCSTSPSGQSPLFTVRGLSGKGWGHHLFGSFWGLKEGTLWEKKGGDPTSCHRSLLLFLNSSNFG